jgi:hypothetical protein
MSATKAIEARARLRYGTSDHERREQFAETAQGLVPVHELGAHSDERTVCVSLTISQARALDELISQGASVMLRARGSFPARDLQLAQRAIQLAALRS